MKIEQKITSHKNYGGSRSTDDIVYIVVKTIDDRPITHYHVVNGTAIQLIPDENISESVNGARMCFTGYLHGICTRYNCVSIGVPEKMSRDDKKTLLYLVMTLKQRYRIYDDNIVRLKDVTGECNPEIYYDDGSWKRDIKDKLIEL